MLMFRSDAVSYTLHIQYTLHVFIRFDFNNIETGKCSVFPFPFHILFHQFSKREQFSVFLYLIFSNQIRMLWIHWRWYTDTVWVLGQFPFPILTNYGFNLHFNRNSKYWHQWHCECWCLSLMFFFSLFNVIILMFEKYILWIPMFHWLPGFPGQVHI